MKHQNKFRILAVLLGTVIFSTSVPHGTSALFRTSAESNEEHELIAVESAPSSFGLTEITYYDEDGNEVPKELLPNHGDRAVSLPAKYDLRDYGYVSAVRDQGDTGTCWAHASLAAAESSMLKKGLADSSIDYSESHLVWFTKRAILDPSDPRYMDGIHVSINNDIYDEGGSTHNAIATLAGWNGTQLEENEQPITSKPKLKEYPYTSTINASYAHLVNAYEYDASDTTAIKNAIMNIGAIKVSYYDASETDNANRSKYYSSKYSSYYYPGTLASNHAVCIVGWDDNFSKNNFQITPNGNGAWLCKNSWGTGSSSTDPDGYFYISYYDTSLTEFVSFEMDAADNYDDIYQYDKYAYTDGYQGTQSYYDSAGVAGANIFTAEQDDNVSAVGFYTRTADTPYHIYIYGNVSVGKPTSGTLLAEQSGSLTYAGYHTVPLDAPAAIKQGTNFSVIVAIAKAGSGGNMFFDNHSNQSSMSYYTSYNLNTGKLSSSWNDAVQVKGGNPCIKAYTRTGILIDETNFPSKSFRDVVLNYDTNSDGILSEAECNAVTTMNLSLEEGTYRTPISLQGIEFFTNLKTLRLTNLPLLELDLSSNTKLTSFTCTNSPISPGTVSCGYFTDNAIDSSRIKSITGAVIQNGTIIPQSNTVTYTYQCSSKFTAEFTVSADQFSHKMSSTVSNGTASHSSVCSICGYKETAAHTFSAWKDRGNGTHVKTCSACGEAVTESHHFGVYTKNSDGTHSRTCADCGLTETAEHTVTSWTKTATAHTGTCADCGAAVTETHSYGAYVKNSDGTHSRTCSVCGYVETKAHTFGAYTKNSDGTHSHTCTACGLTETAEHTVTSWAKTATAHTGTCKDCGAAVTETHSYGAYVKNADGTHSRTCSVCGYVETKAHTFGAYTKNSDGTHSHTCTACGLTETAEHTVTSWTKAANAHTGTCKDCGAAVTEVHSYGAYVKNSDGTHSRTCSVCGYVETKAHTFGAYTKNSNGTHSHTCTACGLTETAEHTVTSWTKAANAHTGTCKDCGAAVTEVHSYGAYVKNSDGTHSRTCSVCGYVETKAHTFGAYTKNSDGTHSHTCTACGLTETAEHTVTSWTKAANAHTGTCKDCGAAVTEVHSYGAYVKNSDGTHSRTCSVCGYVETKAHTFGAYTDHQDGTRSHTCKDCGYTETEVYQIMGDINADGNVTVADVILLQKWLLSVPDAKLTDWKAGDVCTDDTLDGFDLNMLKRILLNT